MLVEAPGLGLKSCNKCDPILEKMVKGGEKKNEFFHVLIENAFKCRLNGFDKCLNEFQER